jgi:hypothetical protein
MGLGERDPDFFGPDGWRQAGSALMGWRVHPAQFENPSKLKFRLL